MKVAVVLSLIWAFGSSGVSVSPPSPHLELETRTRDFVKAVQSKDTGLVQSFFRPKGFTCVDDTIPPSQIDSDLRDHSSYLFTFLFDSVRFHEAHDKHRTTTSLSDVLLTPQGLVVRIELLETPKDSPALAGCSWIAVEGVQGAVEMCWLREAKVWRIDRGLYYCE